MKFFTIALDQPFYLRGVLCIRTSHLAYTPSDNPGLGEVSYDPEFDKDLLTPAEYAEKNKPVETKVPKKKASPANKAPAKKAVKKAVKKKAKV